MKSKIEKLSLPLNNEIGITLYQVVYFVPNIGNVIERKTFGTFEREDIAIAVKYGIDNGLIIP